MHQETDLDLGTAGDLRALLSRPGGIPPPPRPDTEIIDVDANDIVVQARGDGVVQQREDVWFVGGTVVKQSDIDSWFNKTRTQPSVYWLPLTDDQVKEKKAKIAAALAAKQQAAAAAAGGGDKNKVQSGDEKTPGVGSAVPYTVQTHTAAVEKQVGGEKKEQAQGQKGSAVPYVASKVTHATVNGEQQKQQDGGNGKQPADVMPPVTITINGAAEEGAGV